MRKAIFRFFVLIFALLLLTIFLTVDCSFTKHMTKEIYLQSFGELVEYTTAHCNDLDKAKIRTTDAIFEMYSQDLYRQFCSQLSKAEKKRVWEYRVDYLECKAIRKLKGLGTDIYRGVESGLMD